MVEAVGENGYHATRVADVSRRARVSSRTFYQLFSGKADCFLQTYDAVSARVMATVGEAYGDASEDLQATAEAAIRALFAAAVANPAAVRLSLLEINALGAVGIERREASIARYEALIRGAFGRATGPAPPDSVLRAIVGGLIRVLCRRALSRDRGGLLDLAPVLAAWATSYHPSPSSLSSSSKRKQPVKRELAGGRAPGTLAPHVGAGARRGLPRGEPNLSRSFVAHNQRERILDSVTNLTARDGYAEVTVDAIAADAAVSLKAFYEHFADKEDAFLVAYEVGHMKCLATVESAYFAESDWRLAVRAGIATLFEFLASEPSFAHIALVDALIATSLTAERSTAGVNAFARMLVPAEAQAPTHTPRSPAAIEAIAGGIFELCLHQALKGRTADLPALTGTAVYLALAPFVGRDEAARLAATRG